VSHQGTKGPHQRLEISFHILISSLFCTHQFWTERSQVSCLSNTHFWTLNPKLETHIEQVVSWTFPPPHTQFGPVMTGTERKTGVHPHACNHWHSLINCQCKKGHKSYLALGLVHDHDHSLLEAPCSKCLP
jgi:hypothetical protein